VNYNASVIIITKQQSVFKEQKTQLQNALAHYKASVAWLQSNPTIVSYNSQSFLHMCIHITPIVAEKKNFV
jgi:hypothetical protein